LKLKEMNMRQTLTSKIVAATLALGMATPLTLGGALLSSTAAQAGVFSSIKGAAKKVGGAAKATVKNVANVRGTVSGLGAAAKAAGRFAASSTRGAGDVATQAVASVGRTAANGVSKGVHEVRDAAGSVAAGAQKVGRAVSSRVR
jgi:hypothetical protein